MKSINAANVTIKGYSVPTGSRPHDVAPMYNLTNDGDWASSPVDATACANVFAITPSKVSGTKIEGVISYRVLKVSVRSF